VRPTLWAEEFAVLGVVPLAAGRRLDGLDEAQAVGKTPEPAGAIEAIVDEQVLRRSVAGCADDAVLAARDALDGLGKQGGGMRRIERHGPTAAHSHRHAGLKIVSKKSWRQKMPGGPQPAQLVVDQRDEAHAPGKVARQLESWKRDQDIFGHGGFALT